MSGYLLPRLTEEPTGGHPRQVRRRGVASARRLVLLGGGLLLAACALSMPSPIVPRLPVGAFGSNGDDDVAAVNLSSWAFAMSANTHGHPVEGARAVAAVDYLSAALYSPRWNSMSPLTKYQMTTARHQVRREIGVVPGAPSQEVVSSLLSAASALTVGDSAAAEKAVSGPAFSLPPAETLRRLGDLPFLSAANIATQNAAGQVYPGGEGCVACN